jgi:hypothetical protein
VVHIDIDVQNPGMKSQEFQDSEDDI